MTSIPYQRAMDIPMRESIGNPDLTTAMQRVRDIPYLWRVVIFLCVTFFLSGAAFLVRPYGPVAQNLAMRTHITPEAWTMLLWLMIPTLPFAYYLYRNLYVILACMSPFIAIVLIQTWHVANNPNESFFHVIIGGSVVMAVIFMFVGAVDIDTLDRSNKILQEQNQLLIQEIELLKQQVQDSNGDA